MLTFLPSLALGLEGGVALSHLFDAVTAGEWILGTLFFGIPLAILIRIIFAVLRVRSLLAKMDEDTAGFYLWAKVDKRTNISDTEYAKRLYAEYNVTVLPGSYLARDAHGSNPGRQRIRMALVAEVEECLEAAQRIAAREPLGRVHFLNQQSADLSILNKYGNDFRAFDHHLLRGREVFLAAHIGGD